MNYYVNGIKVTKDMFYILLNYQFMDLEKDEVMRLKRKLHRDKILCFDYNIYEKV